MTFDRDEGAPNPQFPETGPSLENSMDSADGMTPERKHSRYGMTVLSWLVVLLVTGVIVISVMASAAAPEEDGGGVNAMQLNFAAKNALGLKSLFNMDAEQTLSQLEMLDTGPLEQRMGYAILVSELEGPDAALTSLDGTLEKFKNAELEMTEEQARLYQSLSVMLADYREGQWEAPSLTAEEKQHLAEVFGWVGRLALAPAEADNGPAREKLLTEAGGDSIKYLAFLSLGVLGSLTGAFLFVVFALLVAAGKIRSGLKRQSLNGAIYIETFAIWLVVFLVMQILGAAIQAGLGKLPLLSVGMFFASLITLLWPVVRGVPVAELFDDIGWKWKNPLVELGSAGVVYLATLPILVFWIVTITLVQSSQQPESEFSSPSMPSHPIVNDISTTESWFLILEIVLTACVAAPVVEETMFRGVLYRHLRDLSSWWPRLISVVLACVINSLVFAAIHPQGLLGIPMLATLAIGFSVAREWRDSLMAPMMMHAVNNGVVTAFLFLVML